MGTVLYDKALVKKLNDWTSKADVQVYSPDETAHLFAVRADKQNDAPMKFPLICLRRANSYEILDTSKQPKTFALCFLSSIFSIQNLFCLSSEVKFKYFILPTS